MAIAELKKISKKRNSGNFGKIFDFGCVGSIQISDHEKYDCQHGETNCLDRHDEEMNEKMKLF